MRLTVGAAQTIRERIRDNNVIRRNGTDVRNLNSLGESPANHDLGWQLAGDREFGAADERPGGTAWNGSHGRTIHQTAFLIGLVPDLNDDLAPLVERLHRPSELATNDGRHRLAFDVGRTFRNCVRNHRIRAIFEHVDGNCVLDCLADSGARGNLFLQLEQIGFKRKTIRNTAPGRDTAWLS